ncbi:hypothetical protein TGAMA5MH_03802 [Trichoderma gamsii]|uniref:Uncharacterized protein n=1 Tax=Trichoderma gamsii TaxID=398673 RepID=A0A2K0TG18_9HYPO|nr:hypothetical protein TGAMA5MH_03802 [Trichoderma gamsii]
MSVNGEDPNLPPPSQSHFAQFENFTPNDDAPFGDEFARLASSQNWIPGSQQYTRERTIAMRQELKLHYFSQSQPLDDTGGELTEEEKLKGYQNLCQEVHISPSDSVAECKKHLKKTLVNIVDLIDARRTYKEVKVWHDFEAFRNYTLQDGHRINMEEAKKDGGYLASLLQHLRRPQWRRRRGGGDSLSSRVLLGRVTKKNSG